MKTTRTILRDAISGKLVPEIKSRGFTGPDKITGNRLFHEYRRKSEDEIHHLSVQMEKFGKPRFVINLSVEPREGYDYIYENGGRFIEARVGQSEGSSTRNWFRADFTICEKIKRVRYNKAIMAVYNCIAALPEIDEWWSTHTSSTHVKDTSWDFPGNRNKKNA